MISILFVPVEETLDLRNRVLRESKGYQYCQFDCDDQPDTFHLGLRDEQGVIRCVATSYPHVKEGFSGIGYQLRGMATDPTCQGKGYGKALVGYLIEHLVSLRADYLWCNARQAAFGFYEGMGFEFISPLFEVPGIGPHKAMLRNLNDDPFAGR